MPSVRHYLKRAIELPPREVFRKGARRIARIVQRQLTRARDARYPTYGTVNAKSALATYFRAPTPELLAPHAETLDALTALYAAHRFDLLGSGWTLARHGVRCRGIAGSAFPASEAVAVDREGRWLAARLNRANATDAARIWSLVDADYVPVDWQLDFKSGYRWSERVWAADIRPGASPRGADIKIPWELARCQHHPQLALAYAWRRDRDASSAEVLAREFRNQVLDFIATNPPRFGVNWVCTMDVAIRVANWLVAYDLFRAAGAAFDPAFDHELVRTVRDHARHIGANLEWHETYRGNHYLADICGLLFASAFLPSDRETDAWLALSLQELPEETRRQFFEEGSNFEASTLYHRLSAEMVVYATALALGLPAARLEKLALVPAQAFADGPALNGPPPTERAADGAIRLALAPEVSSRLERAAEFTMHIADSDGRVPQIGDNDSGRFLRLPGPYVLMRADEARARYRTLDGYDGLSGNARYPDDAVLDHRNLVAAVGALVPRDDFARFARGFEIETALVSGLARGHAAAPSAQTNRARRVRVGRPEALAEARAAIAALAPEQRQSYRFSAQGESLTAGLEALAYPMFGLFVLRSPQFRLVIRCGALTSNLQGSHAHLDQLAVDLLIGDRHVIADPGSYVYTPLPDERNRYRSVAAHFAPRIDGREPGDLSQGLFVLSDLAAACCLCFGPEGFAGAHEGFGCKVVRAIVVSDAAVTIEDGSMGPPLAHCSRDALTRSPKYGALDADPGRG